MREWNERDRQLAVIRVSRITKSLNKSYICNLSVIHRLKSVAFLLWQRLASQEKTADVNKQLESTVSQLDSVKEDLTNRMKVEAVNQLQDTMKQARQRTLTHVFNRWSCLAARLHEEEVVTIAKDKERENVVAELTSQHEESMWLYVDKTKRYNVFTTRHFRRNRRWR